jgi:hypothetical protein
MGERIVALALGASPGDAPSSRGASKAAPTPSASTATISTPAPASQRLDREGGGAAGSAGGAPGVVTASVAGMVG